MRISRPALPAALLLSACASAAPVIFVADLSGPNESPANASPGTGFARVIIDTTAHTLQRLRKLYRPDWDDDGIAHSRADDRPVPAEHWESAGVATQTPSFIGFPLGVTAGSFSNTYDLTNTAIFQGWFRYCERGNGCRC